MRLITGVSRRTLIKSAGATALSIGIGMPAISRAQGDTIKIGHLTPRTGFLGPLGDYAVMGIQLAADEINAGGGVNGRKIELVLEDSVNPQTASAKAERLVERDKVAMLIGEISSASGLAIGQVAKRTKTVFINTGCNSDALRGSDCNQYMFHIEGANSMYVQAVGTYLLAREPGQRQEVVLAHGRLRVRPRSPESREDVHGEERRPVRRRRAGADRRLGLLAVPPEDPPVAPGHRDLQPRRQPDHQLPQAVFRIRPAVPGGRLRVRHGGRLGPRQGQLLGRAGRSSGITSSIRRPRRSTSRRSPRSTASRRRTSRWGDYFSLKIVAQSMAEMKSTDPVKLAEHFRKGAKFDIGKIARRLLPRLRQPDDDGDVRGAGQGGRRR